MSHERIAALTAEMADLAAQIARRESQASAPDTFAGSAGTGYRNTKPIIAAAKRRLHTLACESIALRVDGGGWDPVALLRNYGVADTAPEPRPVIAEDAPPAAHPTVIYVDTTRVALAALLQATSMPVIARSKLAEILADGRA